MDEILNDVKASTEQIIIDIQARLPVNFPKYICLSAPIKNYFFFVQL